MRIPGAKLQNRSSHGGDMGIGMISIFTLIVILCVAVLAVLAFSTAHSSLVLSQRQAASTQEIYLNETAAQTFVAGLDGRAGEGAISQGVADELCTEAEQAAGGSVEATATVDGDVVRAVFTGEGGRILEIEVALTSGGSYRIDGWQTKAMDTQEQPIGTLYSVNES